MTAKTCSKCKAERPLSAFYPCRKNGTQSWCIDCLKARRRGASREERRAKARANFADRFWSHVSVLGPADCWLWSGQRHKFGYGLIYRAGDGMVTAHRASWELRNGPIPKGLSVLHDCDNPPCCNPSHLHIGTQTDNMREMTERGRGRIPHHRGESNNKAKLTEAQVREIRARYAAGRISIRQLAAEYGVTFAPVQHILSGKTWRHVS